MQHIALAQRGCRRSARGHALGLGNSRQAALTPPHHICTSSYAPKSGDHQSAKVQFCTRLTKGPFLFLGRLGLFAVESKMRVSARRGFDWAEARVALLGNATKLIACLK